jgi:hypothetical protein
MYSPVTGIRTLAICHRTDGICTETLDCEKHKSGGVCKYIGSREIKMPKRDKGVF